jgi:hypothetical protein
VKKRPYAAVDNRITRKHRNRVLEGLGSARRSRIHHRVRHVSQRVARHVRHEHARLPDVHHRTILRAIRRTVTRISLVSIHLYLASIIAVTAQYVRELRVPARVVVVLVRRQRARNPHL